MLIAPAGVLDYINCLRRNQWHLEHGEPYRCLVPVIKLAILAELLAKIIGPIPLPLEVVQFAFQNHDLFQNPCHTQFCEPYSGQAYRVYAPAREPDLYHEVTGEPLWLRLAEEPIGIEWLRYLGAVLSAEEP